jgi:hypothetical protein
MNLKFAIFGDAWIMQWFLQVHVNVGFVDKYVIHYP